MKLNTLSGTDQKTVQKYEKLKEYLNSLGSAAVAFSGGVDSTFLLKTAHDVLGNKAVAVTARLRSFPKRELAEAEDFCKSEGIRQLFVDIDELEIDGLVQNPVNRCYICKSYLFEKMRDAADGIGIKNILEGSNTDDEGDYRPGLKAVAEMGIKSPLRRADLGKSEIRELSKRLGLKTWSKPSLACLMSRFPYGETITEEKLDMIEKAEDFLRKLGFSQIRVRIHGSMARIEAMKDEFSKMIDEADSVNTYLKSLGFSYISLDLGGYRTGSMNDGIKI